MIPGLLSLRYAWNHGVSFSLLWQDSETGSRILIGLLLILSVIVAVFAWRARSTLLACGLGLVLGGALGNLLDRLLYGALLDRQLYGAVLDFLAVHLGDAPLFVCNLSDIFISAGAALLMAAELRSLPRRNQT